MKSVSDFIPHPSTNVFIVHFQVIPKKTWSVSNFSKHIHGVKNVLFWPCGRKVLSYKCTGLCTCLKHTSSVAAIKTKQQGRFLLQQKKLGMLGLQQSLTSSWCAELTAHLFKNSICYELAGAFNFLPINWNYSTHKKLLFCLQKPRDWF